jgi:hypothetical protein
MPIDKKEYSRDQIVSELGVSGDQRDRAVLLPVVGQARYLGRMFEDDLNTLPIGAVVLVDARAERVVAAGFSVFASAQNLFDRHYLVGRAGIDTEGAPRAFELGVAYHAAPPR